MQSFWSSCYAYNSAVIKKKTIAIEIKMPVDPKYKLVIKLRA
jgi:hypothetical protein